MAKRTFNRPPSGYTQYPSEVLPERWPLATQIISRSTSFFKDPRLINCYVELDVQNNEYIVEKRPGTSTSFNLSAPTFARGMFNWRPNTGLIGTGGIYSIYNGTVYKNNAVHGAVTAGTTPFCFEPMIEGPYLFIANGAVAYYTDGLVLTPIVDPDFPLTFCHGAAYLNGRMYIIRQDGGIQGSDFGLPGSWDPLNVIFARNNPDGGVSITKQLSYIVALKQWTTEFFEDVGNPTGSVLQVVDGSMLNYGCSDARSVVEMDGNSIWITSNKDSGPQVGMLNNLSFKIISNPTVDRILQSVVNFATNDVNAFPLKVGGHKFYVLNLDNSAAYSLVYDIDQNFWTYWTSTSGTGIWPYVSSCSMLGRAFPSPSAGILLQQASLGGVVLCDADYVYPTDAVDALPAPVDIYTPNFDYVVDRVKQLNMKRFNADQTPGSILQVRYSDDDYQTYSNFRRVDLGLQRPTLDSEGSFYRRSYHYHHACPTPLRIRSVDLQIDIGTG